MASRVEVDFELAPVRMPARILHELCQHALETLPEECCGLIVGDARCRYLDLVRCRNEMTAKHQQDPTVYPRDGRAAFYMSEHDYLNAWREAERAGRVVTAVYHSHVGAGPYLSEMDVAYAQQAGFPFPDADHIVVPVFEYRVQGVAVFRRSAGGFTGHAVERMDP
jgi:proteasome lid subunit RPN8/RPN11